MRSLKLRRRWLMLLKRTLRSMMLWPEPIPDGDQMDTDAEKAEAGNLEQAWQMFDLAKVIYGKAGDVAKECEALTFLGEVSLENSNFEQAVEDLTLCLAKRIKALPADSRAIAETHYQLGVAQAH